MIYSEYKGGPLPFQDLLDIMKMRFPKYHVHAQFYQSDLSFKLEYLELITLRYTHTKKRFVELFSKTPEMTSEETFEFLQSASALQLDADSFLIFVAIEKAKPFALPTYYNLPLTIHIN